MFFVKKIQACTHYFACYDPYPIPPFPFVLPVQGLIKVMEVVSVINKEINGVKTYVYFFGF